MKEQNYHGPTSPCHIGDRVRPRKYFGGISRKPDTEEKLYTTSEIKAGDRDKVITNRATTTAVSNQESKA